MIDSIISRAQNEIPRRLKKRPWSVTDHGRKLLQSQDELAAYMCAYGEMHKSKCFAALQNFPFEKLPSTFEIVDWGCGQAVGTICITDFLYDRGLLNSLKRVTLIEPAEVTLGRATENVSNALRGWNIDIQSIPKYLPSQTTDDTQVTGLELNLPGTIHIFSNILDITAVSLRKTAEIIANGRGPQFVICVGPMNENSPRIDEFSEFFINKTIFSNIADWEFGFTSDTMHPFSCKTKAFYFENTTYSIANVIEGHYTDEGAHDDYDLEAMVRRGTISMEHLNIYRKLTDALEPDDKIFLKPRLKGDRLDIILVRPNRGIVLLNVFDGNLDDYVYEDHYLVNGEKRIHSPLKKVYTYRTHLIEQHSQHLLAAAHTDKKGWFIVRPVVWFTNSSRVAVDATFATESRNRHNNKIISGVITLSREDFENNDIFSLLDVKYKRDVFTEEACKEVIGMLITQWHSYKEGDSSIVLTRRQRELAKSYEGRHKRIKGIAGSGKTQVLASSAVLSQLRTGGSVLILTYNITLANYIRYRINRVPADFPWNKFLITNYHNFITMMAKNQSIKVDPDSYDKVDLFSGSESSLPKFSAIFIDEAQDYRYDWFKIIHENFLKEGGEFVVFGDEKQDIYRRGEYGSIPNLGNREWGPWTKLNTRHRQSNQNISDLCNEFQKKFFSEPDIDETEELQLSFSRMPRYIYLDTKDITKVTEHIIDFIENDNIETKSSVILSQSTSTVREIDAIYREKTAKETTRTFESQEYYLATLEEEHDKTSQRFIDAIEGVRTNAKTHFTMMTENLKLSTIYSYKGWEADNVFVIITNSSQDTPEVIYTALTRAKENLYIINIRNRKYHSFFTEHLQ